MDKEHHIEKMRNLKCAVVIPTYNNAGTIESVIRDVREYCSDVIVVNDGSTDSTPDIINNIEGIDYIAYTPNHGKGHALRTGLNEAYSKGFTYALTLDSDRQHHADDIPKFVEAIEQEPDTLFIGSRRLSSENMPLINTFASRFSNFWYMLETARKLDDTQSGFRLYPLIPLRGIHFLTSRYEFEMEVIVRAAWQGVEVKNIPITVNYPTAEERVSHFKPARDYTRLSILNACLMAWALIIYHPSRFFRWLTWKNIKKFIDQNILHSADSNPRMALSIGWGVMWGMMPVWGWQAIIATASGYFMRLNKTIVFVTSNISTPPMTPFIIFGGYYTGGLILSRPILIALRDVTLAGVMNSLLQYVVGSIVFAVIAGLLSACISLIIFKTLKRKPTCNA